MARCVPYSPRGARDLVAEAMAEPAAAAAAADKLQKEREMMQKKEIKERKEKKRQKKRQKKAAQLGERYEIPGDHSKHLHKKRKHEGQNIVVLETKKDCKDTVEQFEKSGLSEEHEAPSCSPPFDCTPESSLDSNKRLRATVSPSPSQPRNGVFRVNLESTNQRRDPESTALLSAKPRALEQQSVKQMGLDLSMAKSQSDFQPHINTVTVQKQLVASEQKMAVRNGNQLSESRQVNQQQPAIATQRVIMVPRASPQPTPKVMQRVDPPPAKVLRMVESAPVKVMKIAGQQMPSKVFQRDAPQVPANMLKKPTVVAAPPGQLNVKLPALLHKPKTSAEPPVVNQRQKMALMNGNQLGESRQMNQQQPAMVMQRVNMFPRHSPQPIPKMLQRVNPPSRKVLPRADLARANVIQRPDHLMPSKMFERETPQVPANIMRNATTDTPHGRPSEEQPALLHRPKVSVEAPVVKPQQQIDTLPKNDPSTVRASIAAALAKEVKQSSSERKDRKAEKKEREFADLFVTWKPSPIQTEDMDIGDQDWLFNCGTTPRSNCRAFDGSARCQPTEQLFSMQPGAVDLPDLHMYQLPYVVPF